MKRTRRVEIIRYSRRTTVNGEGVALEPDLTAEQAANDILLAIPGTNEFTVEETGGAEQDLARGDVTEVVERRRPFGFLKKLVRG